MAQITLRVPDDEAVAFKEAAARAGQSLNEWATAALRVRIDPELAGDEAARIRERLQRAGLLAEPDRSGLESPDPAAVEQARAAAGRGTPLADLVGDRGSR